MRDLLIENPYRGPYGEEGLRVYHFDRFPYTVVYEPDAERGPQIFSIAHQHSTGRPDTGSNASKPDHRVEGVRRSPRVTEHLVVAVGDALSPYPISFISTATRAVQ